MATDGRARIGNNYNLAVKTKSGKASVFQFKSKTDCSTASDLLAWCVANLDGKDHLVEAKVVIEQKPPSAPGEDVNAKLAGLIPAKK